MAGHALLCARAQTHRFSQVLMSREPILNLPPCPALTEFGTDSS